MRRRWHANHEAEDRSGGFDDAFDKYLRLKPVTRSPG